MLTALSPAGMIFPQDRRFSKNKVCKDVHMPMHPHGHLARLQKASVIFPSPLVGD
jgi:hypothetical protein